MAQIAPIVTLLGTGASLYATARQAQAQSSQTGSLAVSRDKTRAAGMIL